MMLIFVTVNITQVSAANYYSEKRHDLLKKRKRISQQIRTSRVNVKRLSQLRRQLKEIRSELKYLSGKSFREKSFPVNTKSISSKLDIKPVTIVENPAVEADDRNPGLVYESGVASYYASKFDGRTTASGDIFFNSLMTAAHRTLPFGTIVKVRNTSNDKTVTVTVNDRGPFVSGRIIDLSSAAFSTLDNLSKGIINVEIEIID